MESNPLALCYTDSAGILQVWSCGEVLSQESHAGLLIQESHAGFLNETIGPQEKSSIRYALSGIMVSVLQFALMLNKAFALSRNSVMKTRQREVSLIPRIRRLTSGRWLPQLSQRICGDSSPWSVCWSSQRRSPQLQCRYIGWQL